jgi:hypothetical protein
MGFPGLRIVVKGAVWAKARPYGKRSSYLSESSS